MANREEVLYEVQKEFLSLLACGTFVKGVKLGLILSKFIDTDITVAEHFLLENYKKELQDYITLKKGKVKTLEIRKRIDQIRDSFLDHLISIYEVDVKTANFIFFTIIKHLSNDGTKRIDSENY